MPANERDWYREVENKDEDEDVEINLVMTGEGFRVEKRKPQSYSPGIKTISLAILAILLWIGDKYGGY